MTQRSAPASFISSVLSTAPKGQQAGGNVPLPRSLAERLWQRFTTLRGRFIALVAVMVIITCATAVVIAVSSSRAYSDLSAIGDASIPSVDAAQAIIPYMEDIDARSADYLANTNLNDVHTCPIASTGQQAGVLSIHDCASHTIDADLQLVNRELFIAGQNASYAGGRTAIEQTQAGLEEYMADINLMRHEFTLAANKNDRNDPHMQQAYQAYVSATNVLHQRISPLTVDSAYTEPNLPSCTIDGQVLAAQEWPSGGIEQNMSCLSFISKSHLDTAYDDTVRFVGISLGLVFGLCIYSCIVIVWATWSMAATTHRLINTGLTCSLLIAILFTSIVLADFDSIYGHSGDFSVIKRDYDNVYSAAILKRYATTADADQARWLLALSFNDPAASQWSQDWQAKTQAVKTLIQTAESNAQSAPAGQKIQEKWNQYATLSGQVATLANGASNQQQLLAAESLHTHTTSQAVNDFIGAVDQFSMLNHNDYTGVFTTAKDRFALLTIWSTVAFLLLGLIGAWSIMRRLKDF